MVKKRFGRAQMTFSEKVVALARMIPKGRVTTYGRIARAAGGGALSSQSITTILAKAYDSGVRDIPFHRIVYADGKVWMNDSYRDERMQLYKKERIAVDGRGRIVDFDEIVYEFE